MQITLLNLVGINGSVYTTQCSGCSFQSTKLQACSAISTMRSNITKTMLLTQVSFTSNEKGITSTHNDQWVAVL